MVNTDEYREPDINDLNEVHVQGKFTYIHEEEYTRNSDIVVDMDEIVDIDIESGAFECDEDVFWVALDLGYSIDRMNYTKTKELYDYLEQTIFSSDSQAHIDEFWDSIECYENDHPEVML